MATTFNSINGFSFGEVGTTVIDNHGNVIANTLSASGNATFTSAATSTSTTTGAATVTGGVGITGNIYVGGNLNVAAKSNLGAVGNVVITGGTSAYVLSTDGLGNLSWVAQTGGGGGGASISNGTSNVNIASVNGNVTVGVSGNANIVQFTGTGVNVAGTLQVTGVSNLGPVGNVVITGGSNGQMLTTDGSGNLTWTSSSGSGNITIDTFTGNGVQTVFTLSTTPTSNNYIQVNIDGVTQLHNAFTVASANVTMSAAPSSGAQIEVTTFTLGSGGGSGGSGTYITRTYTGNGVQTNFTVTSGVTVDSVLVMENGIVQVPTTDYTVSGAVLTFTTAPAVAMGIQIRELATGGGSGGGSNISNGTSNVSIPVSSSNVNLTAAGNTTLVITGTGANITGTLNVSNTTTSGNFATAGNITASFIVSNVTTGTAPFTVTSTTRVSNLNVNYANVADFGVVTTQTAGTFYPVFVSGSTTGNYAHASNSGFSANLANGALIATTFVGSLSGSSTSATTAGTVTTNAQPNITSVGTLTGLTIGNATANTTFGNGTITALGNLSAANLIGPLANGNSNVNLPSANGNVNITAAGNTTLVITGTGANITGTANVSGNITTAGTLSAAIVTETSSLTLKENFRPIENPLEKVIQLLGQIYDRKDGSSKNEAGLVAEEVYKVIPNLVKIDSNGNPESVLYSRLTVYLLESIKILNDDIAVLKGKIRKSKK